MTRVARMIPDEDVERVREHADIVQIIGEHVNAATGRHGLARAVSVPSGHASQFLGVAEEADVLLLRVSRRRRRLQLPAEATRDGLAVGVRAVADKSGIEIREVETRREGPDPREPVWEINARRRGVLPADRSGRTTSARPRASISTKRHVSREAGERFGLGFAPREIGLLRGYLNTLGYDDARLLSAGLLVKREEAEEPRPRFRGRLMFPIYDASGRPSGFGGRLIGPGEPKYLNSADSPTFTKGQLLYGLNWARHAIRRDERLLLVEGYFDVVRLVLAGIESVVAPLGTALTEEQASMIARQTKNVFLLYDSDTAGQKATFRAGDLLLAQGVSVRVVTLPDGEDPDTFVDTHGGRGARGAHRRRRRCLRSQSADPRATGLVRRSAPATPRDRSAAADHSRHGGSRDARHVHRARERSVRRRSRRAGARGRRARSTRHACSLRRRDARATALSRRSTFASAIVEAAIVESRHARAGCAAVPPSSDICCE